MIRTVMSDYHIENFTSNFENISHVEETQKVYMDYSVDQPSPFTPFVYFQFSY